MKMGCFGVLGAGFRPASGSRSGAASAAASGSSPGLRVFVGKIIGGAHEGVEAVHVGLDVFGHQDRAHGKIFVVAERETGAVGERLGFRPGTV